MRSGDSFRYKIWQQKQLLANDVPSSEPLVRDLQDREIPIASLMCGTAVPLRAALDATAQHFERRLKAARSARVQEGIAPVFSGAALGAGVYAGAPVAVSQTAGSFACAAYSYWVCNREVNIIQRDKDEFDRIHAYINTVYDNEHITPSEKDELVGDALHQLDFQMEGVVASSRYEDEVRPIYGGDSYQGGHKIQSDLCLKSIMDGYVEAGVSKRGVIREFFYTMGEATSASFDTYKMPKKWLNDNKGGYKQAFLLSKHMFGGNPPNVVYGLASLQQRLLSKVSDTLHAIPEVPGRVKWHVRDLIEGRCRSPYALRDISNAPPEMSEEQRLHHRVKETWKDVGYAFTAAQADLTLAVLEAGQAYDALEAGLDASNDSEAIGLYLKSGFHAAAVYYSTDAPRFLMRRVSDEGNNLASDRARVVEAPRGAGL